jgi:hypothetical protein
MILTLSIQEPLVNASLEATFAFSFDLTKVVDLTLFVQAVSECTEPLTFQPTDCVELSKVQAEDSETLREGKKLLEYLVKIVEAFNLSFREVMTDNPAVSGYTEITETNM